MRTSSVESDMPNISLANKSADMSISESSSVFPGVLSLTLDPLLFMHGVSMLAVGSVYFELTLFDIRNAA